MTSLFAQIFFPRSNRLLLSAFPNRNSTALSWNNSALFLGMALGSLIGGQAMALGGFTAILPISAAHHDRRLGRLQPGALFASQTHVRHSRLADVTTTLSRR